MIDKLEKNVFEKILGQVSSLIEETQQSMQNDSETYTLSCSAFTTNLLFGIICQIKSIGKLIVEIKTSQVARGKPEPPGKTSVPIKDIRVYPLNKYFRTLLKK